jgi:hypothetical protein
MFVVANHIPANTVVGFTAVAMNAVVAAAPMNQIQPTFQVGSGGLHS